MLRFVEVCQRADFVDTPGKDSQKESLMFLLSNFLKKFSAPCIFKASRSYNPLGGFFMKQILSIIIAILVIILFFPTVVFFVPQKNISAPQADSDTGTDKITVYIKKEDRVAEMDTLQYLKEVVAAEMPVDFHEEALKAQAVAARTYMINRRNNGGTDIHKGAEICTDSTHCKAWISEAERKEIWGDDTEQKWNKISDAVEATDREIITYEGEPISAVFHSTSSGKTENAVDVWGGNVPYLVSVDSAGDSESPKFNSELTLTQSEFREKAASAISGVDWSQGSFSEILRSDAGGIRSLKIGGVAISGTTFRSIFSLRSTNAEITEADGKITITTKGYGHGVGMSQYGANYLAEQGKTYREILKTYYTGIEIEYAD